MTEAKPKTATPPDRTRNVIPATIVGNWRRIARFANGAMYEPVPTTHATTYYVTGVSHA